MPRYSHGTCLCGAEESGFGNECSKEEKVFTAAGFMGSTSSSSPICLFLRSAKTDVQIQPRNTFGRLVLYIHHSASDNGNFVRVVRVNEQDWMSALYATSVLDELDFAFHELLLAYMVAHKIIKKDANVL